MATYGVTGYNMNSSEGNQTELTLLCLKSAEWRVMGALLAAHEEEYEKIKARLNLSCLDSASLNGSTSNEGILVPQQQDLYWLQTGQDLHAFLTPFLILIGVVGNILSGAVFMCRPMRKMSASIYLSSLALADTIVLLVYVLFDWLSKGVSRWPPGYSTTFNILQYKVGCQLYVYVSYVARLLSAYIVTTFIIERYIGICKPLYRRQVSTSTFARRTVFGLLIASCVLCIFKPLISDVHTVAGTGVTVCAHKAGYQLINFIMDGIYGFSITAVPISTISILNILIVRQLFRTSKRRAMLSAETVMRIEATVIILVISTAFVLLNLPFFIVWCLVFQQKLQQFLHLGNPTGAERMRGWLFITKTIFYFNYSFNFFLYSLSGGLFRKQLYAIFCKKKKGRRNTYQFAACPTDGNDGQSSGYITATTNI